MSRYDIQSNIKIKGGNVFDGENLAVRDLCIEHGIFVEEATLDDSEYFCINAEGKTVTPGFIDTHIHGAFGYDTSDADANGILAIAQRLPEYGVVAFCPTTMSLQKSQLTKVLNSVDVAIKNSSSDSNCAEILGVHMEGPMLNKDKAAAQDVNSFLDLRSGDVLLKELEADFPGLIKIVSFAPEAEGREEFIKNNCHKYSLSLAHTEADYSCASKAFDEGANSVTHLLNAMREVSKRAPGVPAAAFDKKAFVEIICDGKHIEEPVLRMLFNTFDENRIITVSDSMRGTGMPDGNYLLAVINVEVKGGRTYFGPNGDLAGSVSNLAEEYKVLLDAGIDKVKVIKSLTINPLLRLRINPEEIKLGRILPGYRASFNIFDSDNRLDVCAVNGNMVSMAGK